MVSHGSGYPNQRAFVAGSVQAANTRSGAMS